MSRSRPVTACSVAVSITSGSPRTGVSRSRARPSRCSSVPMPPGQDISIVDVRRTEPGRRAGGAGAGSEGGGLSGEAMRAPFRKSCFHVSAHDPLDASFRTLFFQRCSSRRAVWALWLVLADEPDGGPRLDPPGRRRQRKVGREGGGPDHRGRHGARLAGRRGPRVGGRARRALPGEPSRLPGGDTARRASTGRPHPPRTRWWARDHRADGGRGDRRGGALPAPGRRPPRRDLRSPHHPRGDRLPAGFRADGRGRSGRATALHGGKAARPRP